MNPQISQMTQIKKVRGEVCPDERLAFGALHLRNRPNLRIHSSLCNCGHDSDRISNMSVIHLESARAPFTSPRLAFQAITALGRADAMGLLPEGERIETLDLASLRKVVHHIHRAGIARTIQLNLAEDFTTSGEGLERALEHLNTALEESPAPEFEWKR